jgi:GxxExxY protein
MRADIDPGLNGLTERIIGAAFTVSRGLGHGFLEIVYKNALRLKLLAVELEVAKEKPFPVHYRGEQVGMYVADIVVNDKIIVELKVADALSAAHSAQVLNYLKVSRAPVGLLLNFGKPRVEVKRIIL